MLDLQRLQRIRLTERPIGQEFFAHTVLTPNYNHFPGIEIELEGLGPGLVRSVYIGTGFGQPLHL